MKCFYNQEGICTDKMTREHVISKAVLKEAFGSAIRNTVDGDFLKGNALIDNEPIVKDVCSRCNNESLSLYDGAGKKLISELQTTTKNKLLELSFDSFKFGWLVKTHLNHFRVIKDQETASPYPVAQAIKDALINTQNIPRGMVVMLAQQWEESPVFWDAESNEKLPFFSYRSIRFIEQRIVLSNLRMRQLDTILMLPSDGNYENFSQRVNSAISEMKSSFNADFMVVDIEKAIRVSKLTVESIFTIAEIEALKVENNN